MSTMRFLSQFRSMSYVNVLVFSNMTHPSAGLVTFYYLPFEFSLFVCASLSKCTKDMFVSISDYTEHLKLPCRDLNVTANRSTIF